MNQLNNRILIADSDRHVREALALAICCMGYEPIEAATGDEAVIKSLIKIPILVIMEISLPGIDGIEAAKRMKNNPQTAAIPIVCHTVWNLSRLRQLAFKVGISEYLVKPVGLPVLKQAIDKYTMDVPRAVNL